MKKFFILSLLTVTFCTSHPENVGLLIMATGKYLEFAKTFINSARKHFCQNHKVYFFLFTDGDLEKADDIIVIPQKRLGWPHDTLRRCTVYYAHHQLYEEMDYLFASDADMLFVNTVGDEVLGERVGTIHPGFYNQRGTYDLNPRSRAYVGPQEGRYYFAGGFHGGSRTEFIKLIKTMSDNIDADQTWGYIARWHDESHLNRYFIDNPPTVILNPSYCYPESWQLPFPKKLLALDKNHAECRA